MQSKAKTVAAYLAERTPEQRAELEPLRKLTRQTLPKAKESTAYGMPSYSEKDDAMICAFAAENYSLSTSAV